MHNVSNEKLKYHRRDLQTDTLSATYNLEHHDAYARKELEKIAVSGKPIRELSCNSIIRTNLEPQDNREVLRRIVCVKLKEDIPCSRRTERSIDGLKGTIQSDIQDVGSDTSPEE